MKAKRFAVSLLFALIAPAGQAADSPATPKETVFDLKPLGVKLSIKMVGPYMEAADLQILCAFRMLELGIPVGAGTDATRVASYNPWVSLYWLVTGKTVGGVSMYPEQNRLSREEALRLYTQGSSWFSSESGKKGALAPGQLADLVALSEDYFSVPEEAIKGLESVLTVVGGRIVYAKQEFAPHAPARLPVMPEWSPARFFGGYGAPLNMKAAARAGVPLAGPQPAAQCPAHRHGHAGHSLLAGIELARSRYSGFFGPGCDCFAF